MKKIDKKEKAIVIIGSGAGGGTMAYELTKAGIPCVCLEAGPYLKPEDPKPLVPRLVSTNSSTKVNCAWTTGTITS